jgi:hypothetical protein
MKQIWHLHEAFLEAEPSKNQSEEADKKAKIRANKRLWQLLRADLHIAPCP